MDIDRLLATLGGPADLTKDPLEDERRLRRALAHQPDRAIATASAGNCEGLV